jgi:hypothetical protein
MKLINSNGSFMSFIFLKTVYIRFYLDETLDFLMTWQKNCAKREGRVPYHQKNVMCQLIY